MAIVQMRKLAICALKESRKAILEELQSMGVMHIITRDEDEGVERVDTLQSMMLFDKNAQTCSNAIEILNKYAPQKKGLLESLNGKDLAEHSEYRRMEIQRESILVKAQKIINLEKEKAELQATIVKTYGKIDVLVPWKGLGLPMNHQGTKYTGTIIGMIPGQWDEAKIRESIAAKYPDAESYDVTIVNFVADFTYFGIICMKEDTESIETALREEGFVRSSSVTSKIPEVKIEEYNERIRKAKENIKTREKEIAAYADERMDIMMLSDYYRIRSDKYRILGTLAQTKNTFFVEGYVPADKADTVAKVLEEKYDAFVETEEISEEDDVPVLLHNNKFSRSAEGILESFGLPGKGEIDPTFWMSVFYVILFGIMLSDAAYGAIVAIGCGIVILKCPRMEQGMKRLITLFFWCGLSTLFWGILFGGYFGDAIPVISGTFFGKEVNIQPVWFAPLDDPMKMLVWSLIFGLIHLFFGLGLKGYTALKNGDKVGFVFDTLCWFFMLIGLILMFVPTQICAGITGMTIVFPDWVNKLAIILAIAGALGIMFMSARTTKNFGVRIALGLYDIYGVTGWLSDVLSYSRLLALGLATGVMGSVFNKMGSMLGGGVIGGILFILVFLVGHVFNLAINLLGAYVHTSRLQYVEFFGKFYEGGGTPFTAFKNETKYVEFKEES